MDSKQFKMKKLLTILIVFTAVQGIAQRYILVDSTGSEVTWQYKRYPAKPGQPVPGMQPGYAWFTECKDSKPDYDSRTHRIVERDTFRTDTSYMNCPVRKVSYEVQALSPTQIAANVLDACEIHIRANVSIEQRESLHVEASKLMYKQISLTATTEDQAKLAYINSALEWGETCRSIAKARADSVINHGLLDPSFDFPDKPEMP